MVAMRYLRARRQEGFISVIAWFSLTGIALGVATLIIVMAVMNGFRQELLTRILGINGHLSVYGQTNQIAAFDPIAEKLRAVEGVKIVSPMVEGQVMATANGVAQGAVVRGFRPRDLSRRKIITDNIQAGSFAEFKGSNAVIIGARMATKMGLAIGDKITLISPKGNATAFGTVPRMKAYRVVATFQIGMYEYDSNFVFMPLSAAQIYFKLPGAVSNLEVFIADPDNASAVAGRINKALKGQVRIHDWQRVNASFFNAIQVERNVMFLILTLIIVVAAFNIISSMIMLVKDKGKDIAILRTMGVTQGQIMRIFFIAGASIGTIGTMAGFALGLAFAENIETIRQWIQGLTGTELFAAEIYFLSQLPAVVNPSEVVSVVLMGLGLSFRILKSCAGSIWPSTRARSSPSSGRRGPASRRFFILPGFWSRPTPATSPSAGNRATAWTTTPARPCAAIILASSSSITTCCRNSRPWKTSPFPASYRASAAARHGSGPKRSSVGWGWKIAESTARRGFPAASSSVSRSPGRWPRSRLCFLPTSRPATWIRRRQPTCTFHPIIRFPCPHFEVYPQNQHFLWIT